MSWRILIVALALSASSQASAEWEFRAMPYIWASGLDGEASSVPPLPPAEVDASFGDVLDNLDIAFFGEFEARNEDFFLRGDLAYASITASAEVPDAAITRASLNAKVFNVALVGGVPLYDREGLLVEAFAGARLWDLSNRIEIERTIAPPRLQAEAGKTFIDPLVGVSAEFPISGRLGGRTQASIGGFGIGADFEYDLQADLFYRIGDSWGAALGYRYLGVDYEDSDDGFVYDMAQHGPYLGVFFDF